MQRKTALPIERGADKICFAVSLILAKHCNHIFVNIIINLDNIKVYINDITFLLASLCCFQFFTSKLPTV